ncbi:hypothetical protein AAES_158608 [Amazona aestiva]|uniref:RING-type domain-containing protein n=1 Tax=Amazona aestiva TaxID=12930 RepID=A0A0Q3LUM6_AMAAE|nr:hypothetical protein AAES_158608 [Amazona aestiva]
MDASEEPRGQEAPNIEVCMSFCRHCFCFPCIQEWARRKSMCPRCQCSVNHIFPLRDGRIHEGHAERRGSDGRRRCPSGRRSSSGMRARGHGRGLARGRSRSLSWHRNSRRWSRRGRRSNVRRRRRIRSMAWCMDHNAGQGLPPQCAVLGLSLIHI